MQVRYYLPPAPLMCKAKILFFLAKITKIRQQYIIKKKIELKENVTET